MFKKYKLLNYNFRLVFLLIVASTIGIIAIGSADASYQKKQLIGVIIGFGIMLFISFIDYSFVLKFYWIIYLVNIVLLVSTYSSLGDSANNAQRWILIGGFRFQPSESAKFLLILFFAQYIMIKRKSINHILRLLIIAILFAIPAMLILKQPDLSTTLVITSIFLGLIFAGGISWRYIIAALSIGIPIGVVFIFLAMQPDSTLIEGYQRGRILAFIDPEKYADTTATQQLNSVIAIGSGQLDGKGYRNNEVTSVKNGKYIIEPQTDFIFAVIGEEFGFKGSVVVVFVLFSIVLECLYVSFKAKDLAGRLIATGMAAWIGFQGFFNLGVVSFILPNTGLPLPFISYGLTSIWSLYIGMGFVLNIHLQQRKK